MIPTKIQLPDGSYVYFKECPKCGHVRNLNDGKVGMWATVSVAGILSAILLGGPVIGLLSVIGVVKLVAAGTITSAMGAKILMANIDLLKQMNLEKWFKCSHCDCGDLFRE